MGQFPLQVEHERAVPLGDTTVVGRNAVDLKMLTYARSTSEGQMSCPAPNYPRN